MGKKMELKCIQNPISRHATFSKRKNGLLKKAFELSVLCDVEVALIVFSETGKIYEFASNNNMTAILGKYRRCQESTETSSPTLLQNVKFDQSRLEKMQGRLNILQIKEKNLGGEDLELLTTKQLQGLENQLQIGVKRIRHIKRRILLQSSKLLAQKRRILLQSSKLLVQKVRSLDEENKKLQFKMSTKGDPSTSALENASVHQTNLYLGGPCQGTGDGDHSHM